MTTHSVMEPAYASTSEQDIIAELASVRTERDRLAGMVEDRNRLLQWRPPMWAELVEAAADGALVMVPFATEGEAEAFADMVQFAGLATPHGRVKVMTPHLFLETTTQMGVDVGSDGPAVLVAGHPFGFLRSQAALQLTVQSGPAAAGDRS